MTRNMEYSGDGILKLSCTTGVGAATALLSLPSRTAIANPARDQKGVDVLMNCENSTATGNPMQCYRDKTAVHA